MRYLSAGFLSALSWLEVRAGGAAGGDRAMTRRRLSANERRARVAVNFVAQSPADSWQLKTPLMPRKAVVDWLVWGLECSKSSAYNAIECAMSKGWLQAVPGLPRYVALGPNSVDDLDGGRAPAVRREVISLCLKCMTKFPLADLCDSCGACGDCCLEHRVHAILVRAADDCDPVNA